ncbi:MAG: helix-hairpin-helix domain-containing protein [Bacteroidales bacterium]
MRKKEKKRNDLGNSQKENLENRIYGEIPKAQNFGKKLDNLFSKGVLSLIMLLLIIQLIFFIDKAIKTYIPTEDSYSISNQIIHDTIYVHDTIQVAVTSDDSISKILLSSDKIHKSTKSTKSRIANKSNISAKSAKFNKPYIPYIPKKINSQIELNSADSLSLISIPGIGPFYAHAIIKYRRRLGGSYASLYQLMELWKIDSTKFNKISKYLYINSKSIKKIDFRTMKEDSMKYHPYIGYYTAKSIVRYRKCYKSNHITVEELKNNGILNDDKARALKLYE